MSFSKAKLLRFNEEMTCAPPPGKYDPKFDSKIKGAVIEKSKRFAEVKVEPAPSVCSLDSGSSCSLTNKPTFRTPQLPRKKPITTPKSAIETGKTYTPSIETKTKRKLDDIFKFSTEKNLIEQIDELTRVHSAQLIEKDQELSSLYNEVTKLKNTIVKLENSREIDYNTMKQKYDVEMNNIKTELDEAHNLLERESSHHEELIQELTNKISILDENLKNSNSFNSELECQMSEKQSALDELKNRYAVLEEELQSMREEMARVVEEKETEITNIKENFKKQLEELTMTSEHTIESLSEKMEERYLLLANELEQMKIDDQEDLFRKMELLTSEVKEKVMLFDSQAAEAFDAVKNITENFDEKSKDLIESLNDCAKINCDKLNEVIELSENLEAQKVRNLKQKIEIVNLEEQIETLKEQVEKLKKQCRKYEIVQSEVTKTIQVLSTRLFESESEVENMNETKEELILRKNALEEKINALRSENEDLREKISDLEVNLIKDVMEVERNLISKVENFQKSTCNESSKLKAQLEEKQKSVEGLLLEVETYQNKVWELNEHKLFYEEIITKCKEEIESLSYKFKDVEQRYNRLEELKRVSDDRVNELEKNMNVLREEKAILENECQDKVLEINNLKLEIDQLKDKLMKVENDIAQMEETGFEHEKHIEELAMQLKHYTDCGLKSTNQINSLTNQLKEKQMELDKAQEEFTEKDLKIETLSAELSESKMYIQTMTEHVVALMGELSEKTREVENLMNEIEMKNGTMVQVSEEYEEIKKMYEDEVKKCEEMEKELHDMQSDNEKYVDELISELVLEKERCTDLTQTSEEALSELRVFQQQISLLEGEKEKLALREKEIEELKQKINENEYEKVKLNDIINSCHKQIQILEEKSQTESEELQNKINSLEASENCLNDEIFRLNNLNNAHEISLKEKESQIVDLKEGHAQLMSKLSEIIAEKDDLVEMAKHQWEEMELLTNEISNQQEEIDDLKKLKDDKFEEVRALHQAELQNQIFALQQSLEDTQKAVIQLKAKEEDLVFKLNSAEADLTQAETDKESYEKNLVELNCKITDLESKFVAMEKRKNEYKMYAIEMEQDKQKMKLEIDDLHAENEKLQEEKHEDSMSVTSLSARIADLECRNQDLENIIGPFREQLIQFESERAALLSKSENTEKELKALALEHAKALGHQNHKQKIRHVVHLTETICDLKKEMEKIRAENNKLRATILENQESTLKKSGMVKGRKERENKENTFEATSPLVKHKAERQSSPANPLKQRNIT
ncbi:hyaluronan mediated motility receptor-like isoform X2 [Cimex lectularius]|uniref:Hyaluronan-mediated motility receptor C-terminal domain-containing protein n=1 Tax=Cimex lectularius TaxID=79782 RepID=A0A8I6S0Y2_CIMLE|nr:hyaluronan mediated motility receptor-like isoform X2 [Cimex lectularius]